MAFDLGDDGGGDGQDCPMCEDSGIIYDCVPMLLVGCLVGQMMTKRACPLCLPDLSKSCAWCAGMSSPGFWVEALCNGQSNLLRRGTHSCPGCCESKEQSE
jgi:hypothetical protein